MTSTQKLPLERDLESRCVDFAESEGWISLKADLAQRDWPDRFFFGPWGQLLIVEFKRRGQKARRRQKVIHQRLLDRGHPVSVVDHFEQFRDLLAESMTLTQALAVDEDPERSRSP